MQGHRNVPACMYVCFYACVGVSVCIVSNITTSKYQGCFALHYNMLFIILYMQLHWPTKGFPFNDNFALAGKFF